jgi:hypothetical protein
MSASLVWSRLLCLLVLLASVSVQAPSRATEELSEDRITEERDLAEARFEARQADVKDLARQRETAIREAHEARMDEYRAGRGTLDLLLEVQRDLAKARQPLRPLTGVNRNAVEDLWRSAWEAETLARFRYEAGQCKAADYFHTRYHRLDAEVQLALSRPKKK